MAGEPLIAEHEQVGKRSSGFGVFGVVTRDENGIMCNECGAWFGSLSVHLRFVHDMSTGEYRDRHGLPRKVGLVSLGTSARISEKSTGRITGDPEAWGRFTTARDDPENKLRAVDAARAAGPSPAGRAVYGASLRRARKGTGKRVCTVCGTEFEVLAVNRYRSTCSDDCSRDAKRAANVQRGARAAGEPMNFERRSGYGGRVTRETCESVMGVSWDTMRSRMRRSEIEPDGRVEGQIFWWRSNIPSRCTRKVRSR